MTTTTQATRRPTYYLPAIGARVEDEAGNTGTVVGHATFDAALHSSLIGSDLDVPRGMDTWVMVVLDRPMRGYLTGDHGHCTGFISTVPMHPDGIAVVESD